MQFYRVVQCFGRFTENRHIACATRNRGFVATLATLRPSLSIQIDFELKDARGRSASNATSDKEIRQMLLALKACKESAEEVDMGFGV